MVVTEKPIVPGFENADRPRRCSIHLERCTWTVDHFLDAGGRIFRFEITDSESDLYLTREIWDTAELRNGRVRCLAARLYRESCNPDRFSPLAGEALALEIISEATRHRRYGCSIGEYTLKWRVEVASRQLATSTSPIAEVAAFAGFADQSHLCRTFKTLSGLTPKDFPPLLIWACFIRSRPHARWLHTISHADWRCTYA
jgi:AraC-like DNA-binding protein